MPEFMKGGIEQMNDFKNLKLSTFPANSIDALTMLYLENQDLSKKSPSQIFDLYEKTYEEIYQQSKRRKPKGSINVVKPFLE